MTTTPPRHRFTVSSFLLAFLVGWIHQPATNVVKVIRNGMGFEHEQPWRVACNGLVRSLSMGWVFACMAMPLTLLRATKHALFRPAATLAAVAMFAFAFDVSALFAAPVAFGTLTEGTHAGAFLAGERIGLGSPSRENITVLSGQNLTAGAVVGRVTRGIGRAVSAAGSNTGNGTCTSVFAGPEVEVGTYTLTCTAAAANAGTFSVTTPSSKTLPSATVAVAYTSRHVNFTLNDGSSDFIVGDSFTIVVSTTVPVASGTGNGVIGSVSLGPDAKPGRYLLTCTAAASNAGTFSVVAPDGDALADATVAVAFTSRQVNFTIADGSSDFIVGDKFELVVFNQLAGGKVVAWDPTTFDGRQKAVGVLYDAVNATSADDVGVIVARDAVVLKDSLSWGAAITSSQKESAYSDLLKVGIVAR